MKTKVISLTGAMCVVGLVVVAFLLPRPVVQAVLGGFFGVLENITVFLSLGVAFLALVILLWRRVRLGKVAALVPEAWGAKLHQATSAFKNEANKIYSATQRLNRQTQQHSHRISQMEETFVTFQKALDEKDEEIRRYKAGYDQQIFSNFVRRFIKVSKYVDKLIEKNKNSDKYFVSIKSLLRDALEECGVFSFAPEVGSDYRELGKAVADDPNFEWTEDPVQDFKIVKVEEEGYKLKETVIVPSRVVIYRLRGEA